MFRHYKRNLVVAFATFLTISALAHVDWTRVNDIDPDCLALYHFNNSVSAQGNIIQVATGQPAGRSLTLGSAAGLSMTTVSDTPEPIFNPNGLQLRSAQIAATSDTLTLLDGDITVEFWFKWDDVPTSQTLLVGMASGARLQISRDTTHSSNDRFGIALSHGDYVSAPGFTNWVAVGDEEGGFDEWRHVAMAIHSTGMHHDVGLDHDVYNAGSLARIFLNGHATGVIPHTVDLGGTRAHGDSKLRIQSTIGAIKIDEVTFWKKDWSQNGAVASPFSEGRGSGVSSVGNWRAF